MKAFTLIELLVVVAIIGILAAVGVTTFNGFQEKAKIAVVKSNHKSATKFIQAEIFRADAFSEVSQWNSIKKTCGLVNANSVWHTHGQWAFGCLTEDINKLLPLKNLEPVSMTSYRRVYLISADRKIRATLDFDLKYKKMINYVEKFFINTDDLILEFKYSSNLDSYLRNLTLGITRLSKNSKYINSLLTSNFY